jgi:hypothetical protein
VPRCHQTRFEVRELGEIDMVSMALATPDLVARDDAWPAFPAVYLEGHTVLSYGELAGLAGGSGRVLRHADRLSGLPVAIQDGGQPGAWPTRCASSSADQR